MSDLPSIRQRITLGVAPTIDEARALVDALDAMERMPRLISAPGHTTGTIDHTKLRRLCAWDMTTRRPGGSRRIVHAGLTWPGLVVALLDEVEAARAELAVAKEQVAELNAAMPSTDITDAIDRMLDSNHDAKDMANVRRWLHCVDTARNGGR